MLMTLKHPSKIHASVCWIVSRVSTSACLYFKWVYISQTLPKGSRSRLCLLMECSICGEIQMECNLWKITESNNHCYDKFVKIHMTKIHHLVTTTVPTTHVSRKTYEWNPYEPMHLYRVLAEFWGWMAQEERTSQTGCITFYDLALGVYSVTSAYPYVTIVTHPSMGGELFSCS